MSADTVLIEEESRAIRRGVPDPRMPLPQVAWLRKRATGGLTP